MKTVWNIKALSALIALAALCVQSATAATQYHRVIWDSDPSSRAVIAFSPNGNSYSQYILYGYSTDESNWNTEPVTDTQNFGSLQSSFVRLSGLQANAPVYYKVCDHEGCSERLWFKTAPTDNTPYVAIAGGDTRTGWDTRREGNRLIAKIRPLFIMHGGDFTNANSSSEMKQFLADWALTYSDDIISGKSYKRVYPLIPTHGNHEDGDYKTVCRVFGADFNQDGSCSNSDTFGAFNVSPLLRVYTLNSQFKNSGMSSYASAMNNWLYSDLAGNGDSAVWRFAQYHKPIFPHYSGKSDNDTLHDWWADAFYSNAMNLVVESDTHIAKVTKALKPSGSGFAETTSGGTVYVGEGSWGAPARSANDPKSWTIDLAGIQQFKVITVTPDAVEVRTAQFDASAATLTRSERANDPVKLPVNVNWWNANGLGEVMTLVKSPEGRSIISSGAGNPGDTLTLPASDDTYVSSTNDGKNHNGDELLADGSDLLKGELMSLIKFDLNQVPDCASITSATLQLEIFNTTDGAYKIYSGKNGWSEATATWDSVGGAAQQDDLITSFTPGSKGAKNIVFGQQGIDAVNGWLNGANNGLIIASSGTTNGIDFNSKEMGNGPVLKVGYETGDCGGSDNPGDGDGGFDWGGGSCGGSGSFQQQISKDDVVLVGEIPVGKEGVMISLRSKEDVDIQLFDKETGQKLVEWPNGMLNGAGKGTYDHHGITIEYSGYNGDGTGLGNEYIKLIGATDRPLIMRAYGYAAGYATVEYSWSGTVGCSDGPADSGSGSFQQFIDKDAVVKVGDLVKGLTDVTVYLRSDKDVDVQLVDKMNGTKIVHWPDGMLKDAGKASVSYGGVTIEYSGYNGDGTGLGHEYIKITGTLDREYTLSAYGYAAGYATVDYAWGKPDGPTDPTAVTLKATDDTWISGKKEGSNFNNSDDGLLADGSNGTYGEMMMLIKYDMGQIPACATVSAATIKLNVTNKSGGTYDVYAATESWTETDATWKKVNGKGVKGTKMAAFDPKSTGNQSIALVGPALNVINNWIGGSNNGIVIASAGTSDGVDVVASEQGSGPTLDLTYACN